MMLAVQLKSAKKRGTFWNFSPIKWDFIHCFVKNKSGVKWSITPKQKQVAVTVHVFAAMRWISQVPKQPTEILV